MSEPSALSIKGTAFLLTRRDVIALVESGRLSRVALERRLERQDLPLLDETPLPTSWYPVPTYDRLLRVLMDIEGGGETSYLVQRARKGMEALMRGGIYKQLERAETVAREQGAAGSSARDTSLRRSPPPSSTRGAGDSRATRRRSSSPSRGRGSTECPRTSPTSCRAPSSSRRSS